MAPRTSADRRWDLPMGVEPPDRFGLNGRRSDQGGYDSSNLERARFTDPPAAPQGYASMRSPSEIAMVSSRSASIGLTVRVNPSHVDSISTQCAPFGAVSRASDFSEFGSLMMNCIGFGSLLTTST